jgi:DNA-binding protein HU-beta
MSIADSKNEVLLMADKALTKSQTIAHLADKTGLQKKVVVNFLEEVVALAYREAKNGFTLPGLGKLVIQQRKARLGRNPKTGETLKIPAKKVLKFKIAKVCKDTVCPQKKK